MNRWHVYDYLKGNRRSNLKAKDIENISADEVKEGVIEFVLQNERNSKSNDLVKNIDN